MFSKKREILIVFGIVLLFLALRLPGVSNLYHQDEYKWPIIVNPSLTEPGGIPHPPVGEFIYRDLGVMVGYDNFRIIPLIFSFLNIVLLLYLVKMVGDKRSALWTVFFFAISFYSVLASLMIDTDGAIMPFFLLVSLVSYYKLRLNNFVFEKRSLGWLVLLAVALILGFLTKASFAVGMLAVALDFAFERKIFTDKKKLLKYFIYASIGTVLLVLLLFVAKFVFPYFRLDWTIKYWSHFVKFDNRGWLQTMIQFVKSVMYLSPLLMVSILFLDRQMISRYRPFLLFMAIGLFFYLVAFDFSTGALDRYFQFLVLPLVVLVGAVFAKYFNGGSNRLRRVDIMSISLISLAIFSLQFINHFVPPLYPKTEWFERIIGFQWNFVFPFTGGSGPTGFYVSFVFIALIWICSIIFTLSSLKREDTKRRALFCILILGILYNGVFVEEHILGKINGSSYQLFAGTKAYIEKNEEIKKVVVYNDIGGYEIQKIGKYARRLYAAPQFEDDYRKFFKDFSGHVLYIDIPKIGENNFYSDYLKSCKNVYEKKDKYITASVLECLKP
jgi:hypothetical protein